MLRRLAGSSLTLNEGATNTFTPTYTDTDTELSGYYFLQLLLNLQTDY